MKSTIAKTDNENVLRFYSVTDRLILRLKVAQHFTRSLAEKQALLKFYDLSKGVERNDPKYELHPVRVGHCLRAKNQNTLNRDEFDRISRSQRRFLLPYLTNFFEVLTKADTAGNIRRYTGRACNLRKLPEQKILEDKSTATLFAFHTYHCKTYVPAQILVLKNTSRETNTLTSVSEWFHFLSTDEATFHLLKTSEESTSDEIVPFQLILYNLNLALVTRKICPHLTLPYHLHICKSSDTKEKNSQSFLTTEFPEISLGGYATLDKKIAENEARYQYWKNKDKKNVDEILTPIFVVAYTLFIYSLLGIYERPFVGEAGRLWVEEYVRAYKLKDQIGYWTYTIPPQEQDNLKRMDKFVPNFGVFWLLSDFSVFESTSQRNQREEKIGSLQSRGILYYVIQSLIEQVSTWNRRPRQRSTISSETSSFGENVELELSHLSSRKEVSTEDILDRLEHLKMKISRTLSVRHPLTYREFLNDIIFSAWDLRPGALNTAKSQIRQQVAFSLKEFERNCLLQDELRASPKTAPYLENWELDVFGWNTMNPVWLPPGLTFLKSAYPEFPIKETVFLDQSMYDLMYDAQRKADLLEEAEKFWEVIRKISHLYLRDDYSRLRTQGQENWNPSIPRNHEIQSSEDCLQYGYAVLSQNESRHWYSLLETELLSKNFQIDVRLVSREAKKLFMSISKYISKYGVDFAKDLRRRIALLPTEEDRLFPLNLQAVQNELRLALEEQERKEKEKHLQEKLSPAFVELQKKFSPVLPSEKKQVTVFTVTIEELEDVFPDVIRLVSLLPDVYRNQILAPGEDETTQDIKRELQKRVIQLQKNLRDSEMEQLIEDYPVPKGRRPLLRPKEKEELQKKELAERFTTDLSPLITIPPPLLPTETPTQVERRIVDHFPWGSRSPTVNVGQPSPFQSSTVFKESTASPSIEPLPIPVWPTYEKTPALPSPPQVSVRQPSPLQSSAVFKESTASPMATPSIEPLRIPSSPPPSYPSPVFGSSNVFEEFASPSTPDIPPLNTIGILPVEMESET